MAVDRGQLPGGLLDDIKNYLNITWDDGATDLKISSLIASGMVYLNGIYGTEADYTADGNPRTLLFEYVRYARDAALDVFENNFAPLLLGMRNERAVARYVESAEQTE
jgi:hypothetical protein